jgi:hypothetical protein
MTKTAILSLAALLLALAANPLFAQSVPVTGHVTDDTGYPLPGAVVELRGQDGAQPIEAVADATGTFRFGPVDPGAYELRFSLINFAQVTKQIRVTPGVPAAVRVALPLTLTAEVTVTGQRTFRNLADIEDPTATLIGVASAASEGAVTAKTFEDRPMQRPGDVLATVPGLVVTQHSGEGKANQYYLRGFNLDHGTDFAVSVAGIPVNMPTHGHGQGWSDVNFLIPELVSAVQFKKGPYYAEEGDFSTAGAANINYLNVLERPFARLTAGADRFGRFVAAASPQVGAGHLLVAMESGYDDGPWVQALQHRRLNGLARYSQGTATNGFSITAMGYDARWIGTDQVPRRALAAARLPRFGTLDETSGGTTSRYTLSTEIQRSDAWRTTKAVAYAAHHDLDLFSNFTYALNDPDNGDQFEQVDERSVFGGRISHRQRTRLFGRWLEHGIGGHVRHDDIGALGLYAARRRERLSAVREDAVRQTSLGTYYNLEAEFTDRLRATAGVRGDVYHFRVHSDRFENSGTDTAGLISPKFGVAFAPTRSVELYGNFGYGFHSNDARGATLTVDPLTGAPADRVTPLARTRGGEIGLRTTWIPKLQTTLAVWGLAIDSELVFLGDAGTTEAGRPSRRVGVEWANYYSVRPWLRLDADLAWSSARFTDDDPAGAAVPGAVRHVASVGASLGEVRRFAGEVRVRYLGPRPLIEDATVKSERSMLVNLEGGYRLAPKARLVVDVVNLFDSQTSDIDYYYRSRLPGEPAEGVDDIHTHPVQPRSVRVGVRVEF